MAEAQDGRMRLLILTALLGLFFSPVGLILWMTAVPGQSHSGPLPPLSSAQSNMAAALKQDVEAIASRPHNSLHPHRMEQAARHIEQVLEQSGYRTRRQSVPSNGPAMANIEAMLSPRADNSPTLVIGAHYDNYGNVPGANDNGSGVAAVLALARNLSDLKERSALRLRFVLFANEEPPYFQTERMGSMVYARRLAAAQERVIGMLSLETMGFYSDRKGSQHYPFPLSLLYPDTGNFIAFVGMPASRDLVRASVGTFRRSIAFPSVGGSAPGFIQGVGWSNHWSFAQVGIPAVMITDTAPFRYPFYHSEADTPDKLDYDRLARVTSGIEAMVRQWAMTGRF